jgi:hypothetical protein
MAKRSMAKKKTTRKKAAPARKKRKAMKTSAKRSSKKRTARKVAPKRRAMPPQLTALPMLPVEPVHLGNTGAAVSNLHKALQFFIMHEPGISNKDRHTLRGELGPDLQTKMFGEGTLRLVKTWQEQLNLLQSGDVDQTTANALNGLLRQLGAPRMMGGTHGSGGGPDD